MFTAAGSSAFENQDATARGQTDWKQDEIEALLAQLGLPFDSPISVLCVEMMPTLEALVSPVDAGNELVASNTALVAAAVAERTAGGAAHTASRTSGNHPRPLSDALGQYRILRSSPLTAAPAVC